MSKIILNQLLSKISWFDLETLKDLQLNYLYIDTLAKEQVLQQKIEPNRDYYIDSNFRFWTLPLSQFETLESFKNAEKYPLLALCSQTYIDNNDLCELSKINYYKFIEEYQKHICVVDLDEI